MNKSGFSGLRGILKAWTHIFPHVKTTLVVGEKEWTLTHSCFGSGVYLGTSEIRTAIAWSGITFTHVQTRECKEETLVKEVLKK